MLAGVCFEMVIYIFFRNSCDKNVTKYVVAEKIKIKMLIMHKLFERINANERLNIFWSP